MNALHRFVALYALMYAAFGVSSPFMPAFFEQRGLSPGQIGLLFGVGTAVTSSAAGDHVLQSGAAITQRSGAQVAAVTV